MQNYLIFFLMICWITLFIFERIIINRDPLKKYLKLEKKTLVYLFQKIDNKPTKLIPFQIL